MIICFDEESIRDIFEVIINNLISLSCHTNGLCVIKKIIACTKSHHTIKRILHILLENHALLLQNQHGNYSLQMAIECWDLEYSIPIMQKMYGQFYTLSIMKFSSNVVEKCLEKGDDITIAKFMEEICQKSKVMDLMKNPFGNYVVQKALKLSSGFYRNKLVGYIKKSIEKFTDKKLIAKWNNILSNFSTKNKAPPKLKLNTSETNSNNSFTYSNGSPHSACSNISNNSNISSHSNRPPTFSTFKSMFFPNNMQNETIQQQQQQQQHIMAMSTLAKYTYSKSLSNSPINNSMMRFNNMNNFSKNSVDRFNMNDFN
jgi:hypothetical protein